VRKRLKMDVNTHIIVLHIIVLTYVAIMRSVVKNLSRALMRNPPDTRNLMISSFTIKQRSFYQTTARTLRYSSPCQSLDFSVFVLRFTLSITIGGRIVHPLTGVFTMQVPARSFSGFTQTVRSLSSPLPSPSNRDHVTSLSLTRPRESYKEPRESQILAHYNLKDSNIASGLYELVRKVRKSSATGSVSGCLYLRQ